MTGARSQGYVHEIFRSIQGEGLYVGAMQIFARLSGCSFCCDYCDTRGAALRTEECALRGIDGDTMIANPVDPAELAAFVASLAGSTPGIHSLSVTGGEPLEQPGFLETFLVHIRAAGLPVYLETNGLLEEAAARIAPLADIVSMDIKLPSLCGGTDTFGIYSKVLPVFGARELFCKVVVSGGMKYEEFTEAVDLLASYDRMVPMVIQPVTPGCGCESAGAALIEKCYLDAARRLIKVRVIPQCHTVMGLR